MMIEEMNEIDVENLAFRISKAYEGISGLMLAPRIFGMYSSPTLDYAETSKGKLFAGIDGTLFDILLDGIDGDDFRRSFSYLFGDGFLKHNYSVSIFKGVSVEDMQYFKRFALEVWDTNIHRGFMSEQGYPHHNGTKDLRFCHLNALKRFRESIERHHLESGHGVKGNSAHHTTIIAEKFLEVIRSDDESMFEALEEIIADQSTVAFRWYSLAKEKIDGLRGTIERTPKQIQEAYQKKGLFYKFAKKKEVYSFKEEDVSTKLQKKVWDCWLNYCNRFLDYWINAFGPGYEHWNPPANLSELKSLL